MSLASYRAAPPCAMDRAEDAEPNRLASLAGFVIVALFRQTSRGGPTNRYPTFRNANPPARPRRGEYQKGVAFLRLTGYCHFHLHLWMTTRVETAGLRREPAPQRGLIQAASGWPRLPIGGSGMMAQRRRCSVCGKRAAEGDFKRSGGLCWRCAHPGFVAACMFVAVVASVVVMAIVTHLRESLMRPLSHSGPHCRHAS